MVRRGRSSSPRASAPVRSATRAPPPSGTPMRSEARPKQSAASPTAGAQPPQQGSGLLGQMAATAGGVAIGSAMGHAIGNMFSGSGEQQEVAAAVPQQQAAGFEKQQPQQYSQPCEFEWRQFLECSQNQADMSICQAYNDMFKECKARYVRP